MSMEKLIELLNEYEDYKEKETEIRNYTRRNVKSDGIERIECLREVDGELFWEDECTAIIICKGYMFIKWLVENDKIDTDAYKTVYSGDLDRWKTLTMSSGWDEFYQVTEHWVYESLLMLLSIQEEPISFLISLLK